MRTHFYKRYVKNLKHRQQQRFFISRCARCLFAALTVTQQNAKAASSAQKAHAQTSPKGATAAEHYA
jgi:hypothetical protein